jgi:hypothetical protein
MLVKDPPSSPGMPAEAPPPFGAVLERQAILRLAPGRAPRLAAERLAVSRRAVAARLGLADDEDDELLRHAADEVAERVVRHAPHEGGTEPSPFAGLPPRVPVLVPLPLRALAVAAPRPGLIGVLPLAAAAEAGAGLGARRAELAALGWRLAVDGLDAAALGLLAPEALAADLLLLHWSPGLPALEAALRGVDRSALVLTGCDAPEAVAWGRGAGLALFSGPAADALLAAAGRPEAPR